MNRRAFMAGSLTTAGLSALPWQGRAPGAAAPSPAAYPWRTQFHRIVRLDPVLRLVPTYAQSPACHLSRAELLEAAHLITASGPRPSHRRDLLQHRWDQVGQLYVAAFGEVPTEPVIAQTVGVLAHTESFT